MEKKVCCSYFCIIMSSPAYSDISQHDAKILKNQWQEMQQRHEKEQQLLIQLEEAAKLRWAKCVVQKARREVEEKAQEEAKRQRVAEFEGDNQAMDINKYDCGF